MTSIIIIKTEMMFCFIFNLACNIMISILKHTLQIGEYNYEKAGKAFIRAKCVYRSSINDF